MKLDVFLSDNSCNLTLKSLHDIQSFCDFLQWHQFYMGDQGHTFIFHSMKFRSGYEGMF